jgi:hypothetical protein
VGGQRAGLTGARRGLTDRLSAGGGEPPALGGDEVEQRAEMDSTSLTSYRSLDLFALLKLLGVSVPDLGHELFMLEPHRPNLVASPATNKVRLEVR